MKKLREKYQEKFDNIYFYMLCIIVTLSLISSFKLGIYFLLILVISEKSKYSANVGFLIHSILIIITMFLDPIIMFALLKILTMFVFVRFCHYKINTKPLVKIKQLFCD